MALTAIRLFNSILFAKKAGKVEISNFYNFYPEVIANTPPRLKKYSTIAPNKVLALDVLNARTALKKGYPGEQPYYFHKEIFEKGMVDSSYFASSKYYQNCGCCRNRQKNLHSRLLERAGKLNKDYGTGSLTAYFIKFNLVV